MGGTGSFFIFIRLILCCPVRTVKIRRKKGMLVTGSKGKYIFCIIDRLWILLKSFYESYGIACASIDCAFMRAAHVSSMKSAIVKIRIDDILCLFEFYKIVRLLSEP